MPLLGTLLTFITSKLALVYLAMQGSALAYRLWGLTFVAGIYISCVALFSSVVVQWWSGLLSTTYGMLLGLLFPPAAGTVLGLLVTYWTCIIGGRYLISLTKAAVK